MDEMGDQQTDTVKKDEWKKHWKEVNEKNITEPLVWREVGYLAFLS